MSETRSLTQWVEYIQTLHHRQIDLTLERVQAVFEKLAPNGVSFRVISVGGTNGKGSTAEILSSIYHSAGYRVGKYTSPHLVAFNERICVNGEPVDDAQLLASFEHIEAIRADVPITFFEFGTLLAIDIFMSSKLDLIIMEVGLGGRMDAVNILDPDLAIITNVSIDHTAWLGDTIAEIAREKAGIARADRPCLIGMFEPPQSLCDACETIGAQYEVIGKDFTYRKQDDSQSNNWVFESHRELLSDLPAPFGQTGVQLENAALALRACQLLQPILSVSAHSLRDGLAAAHIAGRCQVLQTEPFVILDVSHNQASVERLKNFVTSKKFSGDLVVVCGMLRDKEITKSLQHLLPIVRDWHLTSIGGKRGSSSTELASLLKKQSISDSQIHRYERVESAYEAAIKTLTANDCLLVFGSFYIVGDILRMLKTEHRETPDQLSSDTRSVAG